MAETELEGTLAGPLSTMFDPGSSEIVEGATAEGTFRIATAEPDVVEQLGLAELMLSAVQVALDEALTGKPSLLAVLEPTFREEVEQKLLAKAGEYDELGFRLLGLTALSITLPLEVVERLQAAAGQPHATGTLRRIGEAAPPRPAPARVVTCSNCGAKSRADAGTCAYCSAPV